MRTRIKICGVRDAETARAAAEAGADAVGFVFVPSSPRYIAPDDAVGLMYALPPLVTAVGVVADLSVDEFSDVEEACPTQLAQLHGDEGLKTVQQCGPGVIKAVRAGPKLEADLRKWANVDEVDAVLIDGPKAGSGEPVDWAGVRRALDAAGFGKPVFLAGGLTPENVGEAIRAVRPYAVDVSSGVESERGVKDHARIRAFCAAVREADAG